MEALIIIALVVFVAGCFYGIVQAHEEIEGVNEPNTRVHQGRRIPK